MKYIAATVALILLIPVAAISLLLIGSNTSAGSQLGCLDASTSIHTSSSGPPASNSSEAAESPSCTSIGSLRTATPFTGPDGLVPDPTTRGRITRRMLHAYQQIQATFHPWPWPITCWDPHLWNPTSDHPKGRACDFTVGHIGARPDPQQAAVGWQLAHWAETNTQALGISYIIYAGHIWNPIYASSGWRPYDGGGIYDPTSITGGHYDHVHISVKADS